MTSRKSRSKRKPPPRVAEKQSFLEDADCDPTLTGVEKAILAVIVKNFDNWAQSSKCSLTFLARGAGTTKKVADRYMPRLIEKGRVFVVKPHKGRRPTLWGVHWNFRGGAMVREANDGAPRVNIRVPQCVTPRVPQNVTPGSDILGDSKFRRVPRLGDESPFSPFQGEERSSTIGASAGAALRPAPPRASVGSAKLIKIVGSETFGDQKNLTLRCRYQPGDGHFDIVLASPDKEAAGIGELRLATLTQSLGTRGEIDDSEALHGQTVLLMPDGDFLPDPRNDAAIEFASWFRIGLRLTGEQDGDERREQLLAKLHDIVANANNHPDQKAA